MRKLEKKAKISLNLFAAAILLAGGVFGFVMYQAIQTGPEHYALPANTLLYDKRDRLQKLDQASKVTKKWTGGFQVADDAGAKYDLGEHTMAYTGSSIWVFGGGYAIQEDKVAIRLKEASQIKDLKKEGFYKLSDRKYLLVGESIQDSKKTFQTKGFLYILMDKSGNAVLSNDEVNIKTTAPTIVKTDKITMDIANEELNYAGDKIALKNVIGSTNTFDPLIYKTPEEEQQPETVKVDVKGGKGGSGGTGGNSKDGGSGGSGGIGGSGANGGSGGLGGTGGSGGTGGNGGKGGSGGNGSVSEEIDTVKSIMLRGVDKTATTLKVSYYASDPFGQYGIISLRLYEGDANINTATPITSQNLNLYDTTHTFNGLKPGTQYQVVICHIISDADGDTGYVDDVIKTSTNEADNELSVIRQSEDGLYVNARLDTYYTGKESSIRLEMLDEDKKIIGSIDEDCDKQAVVSRSGETLFISYERLGEVQRAKQIRITLISDGFTIKSKTIPNVYFKFA